MPYTMGAGGGGGEEANHPRDCLSFLPVTRSDRVVHYLSANRSNLARRLCSIVDICEQGMIIGGGGCRRVAVGEREVW